jgi:hypothetical protein
MAWRDTRLFEMLLREISPLNTLLELVSVCSAEAAVDGGFEGSPLQ